MKDWSDDPSHHERTLLPRSYISPLIWLKLCNKNSRFLGFTGLVIFLILFVFLLVRIEVSHHCRWKEGRKEIFYLAAHSTHFYLWLYGVKLMVKDHSHSKTGNPLLPLHGLLFLISLKDSFIYTIPQTEINPGHWKVGRKSLFNRALNTFYFMVIWHYDWTYGKGPFCERRNWLLPLYCLFFLISSKWYFICTIP